MEKYFLILVIILLVPKYSFEQKGYQKKLVEFESYKLKDKIKVSKQLSKRLEKEPSLYLLAQEEIRSILFWICDEQYMSAYNNVQDDGYLSNAANQTIKIGGFYLNSNFYPEHSLEAILSYEANFHYEFHEYVRLANLKSPYQDNLNTLEFKAKQSSVMSITGDRAAEVLYQMTNAYAHEELSPNAKKRFWEFIGKLINNEFGGITVKMADETITDLQSLSEDEHDELVKELIESIKDQIGSLKTSK